MLEISLNERVLAYIKNVEIFLNKVENTSTDLLPTRIIELARSYLTDAKYYYERGDFVTSLSCIAYAEGLLDALRTMGYFGNIDWMPLSKLLKRPRVLIAGSFEFLHPGHLALFKEAWSIGEVYVIVSRDRNFEKFKDRKPVFNEEERLEIIKSIKFVSHAVLGDETDFLKPVENIKPDYILLGPDQWIEPEQLSRLLEVRGIKDIKVLRLEKRIGSWSSTSTYTKLKEKLCTS